MPRILGFAWVDSAVERPLIGDFRYGGCWPVSDRRVRRSRPVPAGLHLSLLRNLERFVNFDPEVSDGAFKLRVPEQQLHGSNISGPSVDQRSSRASQRMRAISRRVQTNTLNPGRNNPGILPSRKMWRLRHAIGKRNCSGFRCAAVIQAVTASLVCSVISNCAGHSVFLCMTIARAGDSTSVHHIVDAEANQIAAT